jgi:phosphoglucosamine mutase
MAGLFGTSGIRGVYGKGVSCQLAMKVGNAAAERGGLFMVARDARPTSPILASALAAGAMLAGAEAADVGFAPTPLLAYATAREKCAGAMITASHNPPEYNGIKLFTCGMEFSREQEAAVERGIAGSGRQAGWQEAGQLKPRDYSQEYIRFMLQQADLPSIAGRKPRVLVDAGNAAASAVAPALLRAAGCEVVELYCSEPGKFVRSLEPKAETLADAAKRVVEKKCDFGVAFDGDGDRAIGIDERGRVLALDVQLCIFCSHFLRKKKGAVVSTVEASLCVKEAVEAAGGRLAITPVGSLHVAKKVKEEGAVFGGEPCGEYIFPSSTPCADGLLASLLLAEIFCTRGRLSSLADAVKTYPIERRKYGCEGKDKGKIMAALEGKLSFTGAKLSTVDGLRYDFGGGWLLLRPSGTEPAIRLTCEFREERRLKETVAAAERAVLAAIKEA